MSYVVMTKPSTGTATKRSQLVQLIDNLSDHESRLQLQESLGILNGSFQNDSDSDGFPDSWTLGSTGGATVALDATDVVHGPSYSLHFSVSQTDGAETVNSTEYTLCGAGQRIEVAGWAKASTAACPMAAEVRWYDENESQVGTADSVFAVTTGNAPTGWLHWRGHAVCPSGAVQYRVYLTGGGAGASSGDTCAYDGVSSRVYHGIVHSALNTASSAGVALSSGNNYITVPTQWSLDDVVHAVDVSVDTDDVSKIDVYTWNPLDASFDRCENRFSYVGTGTNGFERLYQGVGADNQGRILINMDAGGTAHVYLHAVHV